MDFQDLKVFITVAEEGGITRAAERLHFAQSNVTARIRRLEAHLGVALFHRHRRGVQLTSQGHVLLRRARRILHLVAETEQYLRPDAEPAGPFTLGSMESTAAVRLPPLLSRFHHQHPAVELALVTAPTDRLLQSLVDYKLDAALVGGTVHHPALEQLSLWEEELVLVRPAADEPPLPDAMEKRTLLAFGRGCAYRSRVEEWLRHLGILPYRVMEFGTIEAMIGCVQAGLGIGVVTRSVAQQMIRDPRLTWEALPSPWGRITTMWTRRKEEWPSPAMTACLKLFQESEEMIASLE